MRTLLNCGADPAVQNANGHNAVDVASSDAIRRIYIEEMLRATAASEYVNISAFNFVVFLLNCKRYSYILIILISVIK